MIEKSSDSVFVWGNVSKAIVHPTAYHHFQYERHPPLNNTCGKYADNCFSAFPFPFQIRIYDVLSGMFSTTLQLLHLDSIHYSRRFRLWLPQTENFKLQFSFDSTAVKPDAMPKMRKQSLMLIFHEFGAHRISNKMKFIRTLYRIRLHHCHHRSHHRRRWDISFRRNHRHQINKCWTKLQPK